MTNVVIVGAGKGGRALLEMLVGDRTVSLLGIADLNAWAPGIEFARRVNVPVTTDFWALVKDPRVDLIIDVTGNPDVHRAVLELKPEAAEVTGGIGARFMWDLLAERKRSEELEDRYSLVVRELAAQSDADFIIGQNPKMREVAELLARVPPTRRRYSSVANRGPARSWSRAPSTSTRRFGTSRSSPSIARP